MKRKVVAAFRLYISAKTDKKVAILRHSGQVFKTSTFRQAKKVEARHSDTLFNTSTDEVKIEKRPTDSLYLDELLD